MRGGGDEVGGEPSKCAVNAPSVHRRCALVLGIAGPGLGLGEIELGRPGPLAVAPARAGELAASLAAYGYRDIREAVGNPGGGIEAAADVQELLDAALAEPGLVVVHLLTHGDHGRGQTVLYVLGPDGTRVQPSVGEWLNQAEQRCGDRGPVLFVLDVCYAGAAVRHQLQQLSDARFQKAWVLAACSSADPAYDGRLTWALTQVLQRFRSGELRVDPSVSYIPLRRLFIEVDRLVQEQSLGSYPQQIYSTFVPLHTDVDHLEFFPNPRWDPGLAGNDARAEVAAGLAAMLDEALDPRHFLRRAGAAEPVFGNIGRGFFHGRTEQLQQLRDWVTETGSALRVVTGKPGVGKSALLGVMVCAAHPALREPTRSLWDRLPNMPPPLPEDSLAVVYARRRTVAQITASIALQWQLPVQSEPGMAFEDEGWTGQQLIAGLGQQLPMLGGTRAPRLLVVDGVDESDWPGDLVSGVLIPLAAARREDGSPLCRILAAGREEAYLRPLATAAAATGGLIDLGIIPRSQVRPALTAYVKDLLGYGTPYELLPYAPAADVLAEAIASSLTVGPGTDSDPAPQRWGEFLVAGLYVRHLLDMPPVQDLSKARELGEAVPRELRDVLYLDLAQPVPGLGMPVLSAVAQVLAFAEGSGMPEQIAQQGAAAFLPPLQYPAGLTSAEVRTALDRLRFYLRCDVDVDGSPLYRLFHEGMADQLRADAGEDTAEATDTAPAAKLWQHLYAMVPTGRDGSRQWQHAEPYLRRHAARHAAAAGQLENLLHDSGFLTHADPATLAPLLASLPAGAANGAADTYRASYATHHQQPPTARAQVLAVDAARYGHAALAQDLSSAAFWQPVWATGQSRSAGLRLTMTSHIAPVLAVAAGRLGAHDVIISGREDGTVQVCDPATGQPTVRILTGHTAPVLAVAAGCLGDRDVIISDAWDGKIRIWDATTGEPVNNPRIPHHDTAGSVAAGRLAGRHVIVANGRDQVVQVWDAATGRPIGKALIDPSGPVMALAVGWVAAREVIICGHMDGAVYVWDPMTTRRADHRLVGHQGSASAVAVGRAASRDLIVSGGQDGTVRVWDAATTEPAWPAHDRPPRQSERRSGRPGCYRLRRPGWHGTDVGRGEHRLGRPPPVRRPHRSGKRRGGQPDPRSGHDHLRRARRDGADLGHGDNTAGRYRLVWLGLIRE